MSFKTHETKGRRRILYAGCGTGSAAIGMAQRESGTCNVVGIDNSRELIELAKHDREHKALGNIEFMQADLASYADSVDAFDLIIIGNGEMLPFHRKSTLEAAHRLLKDGGCVRGRDYSYMERLPKGRKAEAALLDGRDGCAKLHIDDSRHRLFKCDDRRVVFVRCRHFAHSNEGESFGGLSAQGRAYYGI